MVTQHGKPMFTQVSKPTGYGTPRAPGFDFLFPDTHYSCSPRRHNGKWPNEKGGQPSVQQIFTWFIHVSFLGPEVYGEREPDLIELVADGFFSGYLGKGRGSVKLSYYVCVSICECVKARYDRYMGRGRAATVMHPDTCTGSRSLSRGRVMSRGESLYQAHFCVRGEEGSGMTSLSPGVCGGPVVPGVHV